jgi:hypothetical protein
MTPLLPASSYSGSKRASEAPEARAIATGGEDCFNFRSGRDIDVVVRIGHQLDARTLLYIKRGSAFG